MQKKNHRAQKNSFAEFLNSSFFVLADGIFPRTMQKISLQEKIIVHKKFPLHFNKNACPLRCHFKKLVLNSRHYGTRS
jgi:hypothetical protein